MALQSPNSNSTGYLPPIFDQVGSYSFEVVISVSGNGCDAVTSNEAEVVVLSDPTLADQPISATYCIGADAEELMVSAEGGVGSIRIPMVCIDDCVEYGRNGDYWSYVFYICSTG